MLIEEGVVINVKYFQVLYESLFVVGLSQILEAVSWPTPVLWHSNWV